MPTHGIRLQNIPVTSPTRSAITPISHGITIAPIPATGSITPRLVAFISLPAPATAIGLTPAMANAKANSMAMMTLEVRCSNTVAQNLYHACGMLDVGYRKRYYEDNKEDALIMYRDFVYPEAGENEA